jgi:threonine dehydrogenase-like Zn-dependent dehydrogenase
MKVLKVVRSNKIEFAHVDSVDLGPWDLRISVAVSCLCGSDLKSIANPRFENRTPGHEFSGLVSELSPQAAELFSIGDRVTVFPMMPCHSCDECTARNFRDCKSKKSIGFDLQGSFAEQLVVDCRMVIKLPSELTMSQGALLEHLCCGYRLADDLVNTKVDLDSCITILGDGPIGLANLRLLVLRGFTNVSLFGKHPLRLQTASELGALNVININSLNSFDLKKLHDIDVCVVSAPADSLIKKIYSRFRPGTRILEQTRISDLDLRRTLGAMGSKIFRAFAYQITDFTEVISLIKIGAVDTSRMITSEFSLEEFAQMYPDLLKKHENIKISIISNLELSRS